MTAHLTKRWGASYGKSPSQIFFFVIDSRPDLAIQDLQNFFTEKSSDPTPANIVF